jgi:transcriptional regulator
MRHNPLFDITDPAVVARLIDEHPWATIVSTGADDQLVASHYPVLRDREADGIVLLTHIGRPDDQLHAFGDAEVMVIFQGPHGYISPTWYSEDDAPVPTWNFSVVHCHGIPQRLDDDENLRVLAELTAHFEAAIDDPRPLAPEQAAQIARGTVGLRISVTRFTCKVKASQNKSADTRARVLAALETPGGPYASPELAADMRRTLGA